MEKILFIVLVSMAIYIGVDNTINDVVSTSKEIAAINELRSDAAKKDAKISELSVELGKVNDQLALVTNLSDEAREKLAASRLAENISKNNAMVKKLTAIIEETPEEAITISLLKSKIERDQIELSGNLEAVKVRLEEIKSNNNLLVGVILAFFMYIISFHFNLHQQAKCARQDKQADV